MAEHQIRHIRSYSASDFNTYSRESLPANFSTYTVPSHPDVWQVDMLRIGDSEQEAGCRLLGPSTVLVGHGFEINGNWAFKSGLKIEAAIDILFGSGIVIEALAVCNPGKIELGQNKTYGLGDLKVATYLRANQIWMDVRPADPSGSIIEKSSIRIKREPRISIKPTPDILYLDNSEDLK